MKIRHINNYKNRLLIFFAGFYTDDRCFEEFDDYTSDILFVYDYSDLNFNVFNSFDFSPYFEINMIAYSYGVWAARECYLAKALPQINKSVAIAGTYKPIDDTYGVPLKIFDIMQKSINTNTIEIFERKMLTDCKGQMKKANRTLENLKEELENIKEIYTTRPNFGPRELSFDTVVLTKKDRIIPYASQEAFWQKHPHKIYLDTGHFPFFELENFDNILDA